MNLAKFFNQKAVYWGSPNPDGYGGYTYSAPIEVDVRWTVKQEKYFSSEGGSESTQEKLSKVMVLSETDFDFNGRMMLGTIVDLSSDQDPDTNDALTIDGFEKIPTIKATQFLRKAYLI